jgi:delta1-piperideine-2-carboxylate reductase
MMRITIDEARSLVEAVMRQHGYGHGDDAIVADHLIDCELRGLRQGGVARAISIAERLQRTATERTPIRIVRETAVSAQFDGGDNIGYLVARRATEVAIDKARTGGIAVVGAGNTWYTGMLSYYAEMAVAAGLVAMIASNASAWVAPHGATQGRFGTNPMCFGFPGADAPVIWDIGTSSIIHADAVLARRLGEPLPEAVAYDAEGRFTTDPAAALGGAFTAWGGAKGSGLGLAVQLLGIMAGSTVIPQELAGFGYLVVLIDPGLLSSADDFRAKVAEYVEWVHSARPIDPAVPVRVPFERSRRDREQRRKEGFIELPDVIHANLRRLAGG